MIPRLNINTKLYLNVKMERNKMKIVILFSRKVT